LALDISIERFSVIQHTSSNSDRLYFAGFFHIVERPDRDTQIVSSLFPGEELAVRWLLSEFLTEGLNFLSDLGNEGAKSAFVWQVVTRLVIGV
jgi:hypothetical protein